ncbi:MAG: glycosyltransferase [Telluria sp.]
MRIVFDLPFHAGSVAPADLAFARALAGAAGVHELWIAFPDRPHAPVETVRRELAGLRLRAYALPDAGPAAWRGPVHTNALAALGADAAVRLAATTVTLAEAGAPDQEPFATVVLAPDTAPADAWRRIESAVETRAAAGQTARPRLAYVSPLPPEHSGIADYSAELVPQLARFYDITLVVDQPKVEDARLAGLPVHDAAWFHDNAAGFDRIVYHFGNSHAHQHMFELVRRHPGIVVLHDFFLSGVLDNLEREGYLPHAFMQGLYESHGYTGLAEHARIGRNPSIWAYPLNKGVLDHAAGVIVHSPFSVQLAQDWYGQGAARDWRVVPLLRGKPDGHERQGARGRLGLAPDDFVVCTFGMLGKTKMNAELLDAFLASPLGQDPQCRLVFVGANDPGPYGEDLGMRIAGSKAAKRIAITGFVTADQYADYLATADVAVQLRNTTRGETSASVLDCLLYGVPTIVNAHGSTAALDPRLVLMLPDAVTSAELADGLARLHGDAALRRELSERAAAHMREEHAPEHVGRLVRDAIEDFTRYNPHLHYRRLVADIARIPAGDHPKLATLAGLAEAIAFNQPAAAPRQLLVDISALAETDLRTGIQRVVRSVVLDLIANPPPGFRVEPVYSAGGNRRYHYARRATLKLLGETGIALEDVPAETRPGDVFLGLDLYTNGTAQNEELLASMRARGVEIYFTMYDILPLLRPEVFPYGTEDNFAAFVHTVNKVAHGVVCISRAVADELAQWLGEHAPPRTAPLALGWFHLGADIGASAPTTGLPPDAADVLAEVAARPSFLMVGTVEPRKGHAQALAAFEQLWAEGSDANLVIVGKQGWMVDKLCAKLAAHPEKDRRLFWLPGVSDEMLQRLYASCSALLAPSEGEGFGLPLIEAAQHGIPIVARDIPVFREVAGEHASYFAGKDARALAEALDAWLALHRAGAAPASTGMPWLTWSESTRQLTDAIIGHKWYRTLEEST